MSPSADTPRRRPRPVADVPAVDPAAIAKAWLLGLLADAPLAAAPDVPVDALAREGPELCAALLAALGSDAALERLASGPGARRAGALAGATDLPPPPAGVAAPPTGPVAAHAGALAGVAGPAATVAAVEALRLAAWSQLARGAAAEGRAPDGELADRLAHVCARIAEAAVGDRRHPREVWRVMSAQRTRSSSLPDGPADHPPSDDAHAEIAAHDARPAERWPAALECRLARHADDAHAFAVSLIELADAERLLASGAGPAIRAAEEALRRAVEPGAALFAEALGRWWLLAPGRDREQADADALIGAVAGAASPHGAPLAVTIGKAACPADGTTVAELTERAEAQALIARATGRTLP